MEPILVDRFIVDDGMIAQIHIQEHNGRLEVSIRKFIKSKNTRNFSHTRMGINIPFELYPQLKYAVEKLGAALIEEGLLKAEDLYPNFETT